LAFWIDRGGTFTDVVARDPDGAFHISKLLSQNPEQYRDAANQAIRNFLGIHDPSSLDEYHTLEVKSGIDLVDVKKKFGGRLACIGNID
jgi:5-oxoprolinase (ATP-hydrolysing)